MIYSRLIKWLSGLHGPVALGLLWWGEVCGIFIFLAVGYLLSGYILENIKPVYESWLFPSALIIYFIVLYSVWTIFTNISLVFEGLVHIQRLGGLDRILTIQAGEALEKRDPGLSGDEFEDGNIETYDPLVPPERIRASSGPFRIRYFIVLPTSLVLYLMGYTSTIYSIFTRQILTWEPGNLVLPALATAVFGCLCYFVLLPLFPGYVSLRKLLGN